MMTDNDLLHGACLSRDWPWLKAQGPTSKSGSKWTNNADFHLLLSRDLFIAKLNCFHVM